MIQQRNVSGTLQNQQLSRITVPSPRRGYVRDMLVLLDQSNKLVTLALTSIGSLDDAPGGVDAGEFLIFHSILTTTMVNQSRWRLSQRSHDDIPGIWENMEPFAAAPLYLWGINQTDTAPVAVQARITFDGPDLTRS